MFNIFRRSKDHLAEIDSGSGTIVLKVEKGKTLLNAALQSGIAWPHKCKVGSCGTCKSQVLSGTIKEQIDFGYVLSPEEIAAGFVLACQSELKSDIKVKINLVNQKV